MTRDWKGVALLMTIWGCTFVVLAPHYISVTYKVRKKCIALEFQGLSMKIKSSARYFLPLGNGSEIKNNIGMKQRGNLCNHREAACCIAGSRSKWGSDEIQFDQEEEYSSVLLSLVLSDNSNSDVSKIVLFVEVTGIMYRVINLFFSMSSLEQDCGLLWQLSSCTST